MPFDEDAHTRGLLNRYLDSLDHCPDCGAEYDEDSEHECDDYEPDPDRFRDEDPNELDREDY